MRLSPVGFALYAVCVGAAVEAMPVDLGSANFTSWLQALPPEAPCVMEFYANWCPHCRHFAPTYERLADIFLAPGSSMPLAHVARTDCAVEVW